MRQLYRKRSSAGTYSYEPSKRPVTPVRHKVRRFAFGEEVPGMRKGKNFRGPIHALRRSIRDRRSRLTYVYANRWRESGTIVLTNMPLERDDLVGCYDRYVGAKQLREDLYG
jgi:hypothetical protein